MKWVAKKPCEFHLFIVPWIHQPSDTEIDGLYGLHGPCCPRKAVEFNRSLAPLQWRHNGHDVVSNHQPHGCLLNRLFRCRSKKTSKLRVTGLCAGKSPGPDVIMSSDTEIGNFGGTGYGWPGDMYGQVISFGIFCKMARSMPSIGNDVWTNVIECTQLRHLPRKTQDVWVSEVIGFKMWIHLL